MKALFINGSPRKNGNSAAMTSCLAEKLKAKGFDVDYVFLNSLSYRGCQACMACKTTSDRCILKDDLSQILDSIQDTDVVVFASPVYFADVTAQLKGFIDRMYSFYKPEFWTYEFDKQSRMPFGKTLVFMMPQGNGDASLYNGIGDKYYELLKKHGFSHHYSVRGVGVSVPGEAVSRDNILLELDKTADSICNIYIPNV